MPSPTLKIGDCVQVNLGSGNTPWLFFGRVCAPATCLPPPTPPFDFQVQELKAHPELVDVVFNGYSSSTAVHPARVCKTATQEIIDAFSDLQAR
jgi:hypothetical protein